MPLITNLDADFFSEFGAQTTAFYQSLDLPHYSETVLPQLTVTISGNVFLHLGKAEKVRPLTVNERSALDRAFWKSATVENEGFE